MPTMYVPDPAFRTLADELGYDEAKKRVKQLVRDEATRVASEDGESE